MRALEHESIIAQNRTTNQPWIVLGENLRSTSTAGIRTLGDKGGAPARGISVPSARQLDRGAACGCKSCGSTVFLDVTVRFKVVDRER